MKDELRRKLGACLRGGIRTEAELVYFLVELRKLMDRDHYQDAVIRSYANWVVHTELTQKRDGTTELLTEFDYILTLSKENTGGKRLPIHFNFEALEQHLRKLLKHFELPDDIIKVPEDWARFLYLYAAVVSDCPITLDASKEPLQYLSRVELKGYPDEADIKWKLILKNGDVFSLSAREATLSPV